MGEAVSHKSPYADYEVGEATQITFMRAVPGREQYVARKLCSVTSDAVVYKLFGEADFGIIQRSEDLSNALIFPEAISRYITDVNTITCFNWKGLDSIEFSETKRLPCAGMCFLKANVQFLSKAGIEGELAILRSIKEYIDAGKTTINVGVYGTLGWFETLLLVYGENMKDIIEFTNSLRQAVIIWNESGKSNRLPAFETTTTIPAVLCECGKIQSNIKLDPEISLQVLVSCYSWADAYIGNALSRTLGEPEYLAGTDDFVVNVDTTRIRSLSEYVEKLWSFRKNTAGRLHATRTSFILSTKHGNSRTRSSVNTTTNVERINFDICNAEIQRLRNTNPTIYQMLSDIHARMNDFLVDYRKRSAVTNLLPFTRKLMNDIQNPDPDPRRNYVDNPKTLGEMLETLLFGLQQRSVGIEAIGIGSTAGPQYIGGTGGIQRILLALSSIPTSILRHLGIIWTGFTIVGWANTYHRYIGGVLNMPVETVYHPNLWFGILHEVGHEHSSQINIAGNPSIAKALSEEGLYSDKSLMEVSEIYSEIFACRFGFADDFDQCLVTTWRYLVRLPGFQDKLGDFFLRFLMVYVFIQEDSHNSYINKRNEFVRLAKEVRSKLVNSIGNEVQLNDREIRELSSRAERLRIILDIIKDYIPKRGEVGSNDGSQVLAQGKAILNLQYPPAILHQLSCDSDAVSFRHSVAAILSLWNYQVTKIDTQ